MTLADARVILARLPAEMKLVGPHRSVWQESILPFAGAWRVRFQVPRPGCNSPIGLAASDRKTGMGLRHLPLTFAGAGGSDATLAPERSPRLPAFGTRCCPCRPCPNRLRRRCSSRVRVWPFPPFGVSGNAHKPLTSKGGNRSWLTPNPLLKSASVASRPPFGRTKPKTARGTMSPSPVSTKDGEEWKRTHSFGRN
jgi:hypothetical protein